MFKVTQSKGGQLYYGGMVSIIVVHIGIWIPNNPLDTIFGRNQLSFDAMEIMHLYYRQDNGNIHWTVNEKEYLQINGRNKKILDLASHFPSTNWKQRSNLGASLAPPPPITRSPPSFPLMSTSSSVGPV